jgi:hypothetical protein
MSARALVLVAVARVAHAAPDPDPDPMPCTFDRVNQASDTGFSDTLMCDGKRIRGPMIRVARSGTLTGVSFKEVQGQRERNFHFYDDGKLAVVVVDRTIAGGWSAQARGHWVELAPRGNPMRLEQVKGGLVLHDVAGHTWQLVNTGTVSSMESYRVATIDGIAQRQVPIGFSERGIIGVDLVLARAFHLQVQALGYTSTENRRVPAFTQRQSIFHDAKGRTCAIANADLFGPDPRDPNDPSDVVFQFPDDAKLATFLRTRCPKLDLAPLDPNARQAMLASTNVVSAAGRCIRKNPYVFDPPPSRHHVPQLVWTGAGYATISYGGQPSELGMSVIDLAKPRHVALGSGFLAGAAANGTQIAVAFTDNAPRRRSLFTVVDTAGSAVVPRIPLGDPDSNHAGFTLVAWHPTLQEWGVVWSERNNLTRFARISAQGRLGATVDLKHLYLSRAQRLVTTASGYALAAQASQGAQILEIEGAAIARRIKFDDAAIDPVAAFDGVSFGLVYRTRDELVFVRFERGAEVARRVIARGTTLGTPSIAAGQGGFIVAWSERKRSGAFDDRIQIAQLDAAGAPVAGYPRRLDPDEQHQGEPSFAGTGCNLAVSYLIGDPNGTPRHAIVRNP